MDRLNLPLLDDRRHIAKPTLPYGTTSLDLRALSALKSPQTRSNVAGAKHPQQPARRLPQNNSVPVWLKSLLTMQQGALAVFCSLFGLSTLTYGYSAYTQDLWKSQHGQLKRLQAQEHQQGVMNENLKQQMAQAAEQPESGLVAPNPDRIVVIPSAPQRPTKSPPTNSSPQSTQMSKLPLGY
jgi:hypothetical protein